MASADLDAARQFMAANARVLEKRCFERAFDDGEAEPVRDAVAAYRNPDGGFGQALEPDARTPASQPLAVEFALRALHEARAWDSGLAAGACDWLERTAPAEGGAVFAAPSMEGWAHAPWWTPEPGLPASTIATGLLAAVLHAEGVEHPWLDRATRLMWERIDALGDPGPYDMRAVFAFLDRVPDRDRAERALEQVGPRLLAGDLVAVDPEAPGEVHGPLDYGSAPDSLARRLFDEDTIAAHLDALAAGQLEDGGWTVNWLAWSPLAAMEWRGWATVHALRVLAANGRGPAAP